MSKCEGCGKLATSYDLEYVPLCDDCANAAELAALEAPEMWGLTPEQAATLRAKYAAKEPNNDT